jgi:flagellar motor switch protein FliG
MAQTQFTRSQKAAAILVAMGKPAAGRLLKFFKQEELKALMEAARALRTIPQTDLEKIVAEFEAEFAEGAGLLDSGDAMDTIISETLSPEEMSALMGGEQPAPVVEGPDPVWSAIAKLDQESLGAFLANEHPQTVALILSNLPSESAANAVLVLAKPMRAEVVKRMLALSTVQPAARRLVETQLQARLQAESTVKSSAEGQVRVASLLNELDKAQLDEVMFDLEQSGAAGLETVKAQLFAFEDIPLLPQSARVTLFDGISTEVVTLALRNCEANLVEAALSAVGARSRRMIESELSIPAPQIPMAEVARARKLIAATAIRLAREGVIELRHAEQAG